MSDPLTAALAAANDTIEALFATMTLLEDALEDIANGDVENPFAAAAQALEAKAMESDDDLAMPETIDTSTWGVTHVVVPVEALSVTKVDHEVVTWQAVFCSEDAIPVELVDPNQNLRSRTYRVWADR